MVKYIYIPKEYEPILADAVNSWFSNNNNAWTVIIGVYEKSKIIDFSNTTVKNKNIKGDIEFIKNGFEYQNEVETINYLLNGFCVEGDLEYYTPAFYKELLQYEDILIFNTGEEYLKYINTQ